MKFSIVCSVLLLTGCAPTVTQVGRGEFSITECRSRGSCMSAAHDACPDGFDVIDSGSHVKGVIVTQYTAGVVTRDDMLIQCR